MFSAKMAVNGAEKMKGGNMLSVHKVTPAPGIRQLYSFYLNC